MSLRDASALLHGLDGAAARINDEGEREPEDERYEECRDDEDSEHDLRDAEQHERQVRQPYKEPKQYGGRKEAPEWLRIPEVLEARGGRIVMHSEEQVR